MKRRQLRSGLALRDGVASGVEVARSSFYHVSTHCLEGPQHLLGLLRGFVKVRCLGNPTESRNCATWRCTLNRCLAGCVPWVSTRRLVKGRRGCCSITVAPRLGRHRHHMHAAVRAEAPLRPWPTEPGRDRLRGRTVAQRGCLRLWGFLDAIGFLASA